METVIDFIFLGSKIMVTAAIKLKRCLFLGRKAMTSIDSILKSRYISLSTKVRLVKGMVFPLVMYECKIWTIKKAEHWPTDAFKLWSWRRLLKSLGLQRVKPVSFKGNQPSIFIRMTHAEAEVPIFWPPDEKNWLIRKEPDAGKDWDQEEKAATQDEIVEWHHQFDGHKFEETLGDSKGQQSLACCSPWATKIWTWLSEWIATVCDSKFNLEFYLSVMKTINS